MTNNTMSPKLPSFIEKSDQVDSYIQIFQIYARASRWREEDRATSLNMGLIDRQGTSCIFSTRGLSQEIPSAQAKVEETLKQFIFREKIYLEMQIDLSTTEQTHEGLRDLIVKEQVLELYPRDLSTYLQARMPWDLDKMARIREKK